MSDVTQPKRTYRSPLRQEQAARTRTRVIDAAAELFSERGFGGTTMTDIARAADVSVESVHATGTKAALLLEAFRTRYAGQSGWVTFGEVSAVQEVLSGTDPERGIEQVVDFMATGHAQSARLMAGLRAAAAAEPLIAEHWQELLRVKTDGWLASAEWMVRIGIVEAEVTPDDLPSLAAGLGVLLSAETYLQLRDDWGFDDEQYRAWMRREMRLAVA